MEKDGFAILDCIITDLDGNITSYTDKETAKQLGQYDTAYYYGPKVLTTTEGTIQAGLADGEFIAHAGGAFNDPQMEQLTGIQHVVHVTQINVFTPGIAGNNAVNKGIAENVFLFYPSGKIVAQIP